MEKLTISGYKSIRHTELALGNMNIFIGANGSGKSNLLSFFELLKNIYSQNLRGFAALNGGSERFLHKGAKITSEIKSVLDLGDEVYSFSIRYGNPDFVFTEEKITTNGKVTEFCTSSFEANVKGKSMRMDVFMDNLAKYHFHDTSKNSPFNQTSNVNNDKFKLYSKGGNLAAFLYNMRQESPAAYNVIVKTVQSVAPYFGDFYLKPSNDVLRLHWTSKFDETVYGVSDLSDGTMRFVALCALFLQPDPPEIIIIDEPELGLHPAAITKLAGMMKSAAAKNCQIIAATQSADLIRNFKPEDIVTVDLVGGESIFKRLSTKELEVWLNDYYTIDELWKQNIISSAQPKF